MPKVATVLRLCNILSGFVCIIFLSLVLVGLPLTSTPPIDEEAAATETDLFSTPTTVEAKVVVYFLDYVEETPEEEIEDGLSQENILESNNYLFSSYDYYLGLISLRAEEEGVVPELAAAISRLETGNWTSDAFVFGHNFGGLMGPSGLIQYETEQDGLDAYMRCLKWYQEKGMLTPEGMASVYCPGDSQWAELVREIMLEIER